MATKKEKRLGTLLGALIGGVATYRKEQGNPNKLSTIIKGAIIGGTCGYGFSYLFGSPNDTVNYTHFYNGKRVYEGVTFDDRFEARMAEHKKDGKLFSRVVKDVPKPRSEALKLEREHILKYKPINNIQHNRA